MLLPLSPLRKFIYTLIVLALILCCLGSCDQKTFKRVFGEDKPKHPSFDSTHFASLLQNVYTSKDSFDHSNIRGTHENLSYAYTANKFRPIWVSYTYQPLDAADKLIADLEDLYWDGLDTMAYHLPELRRLKKRLLSDSLQLKEAIQFDTLMSATYLRAAADLLLGVINPREGEPSCFPTNDSEWNAPHNLAGCSKKYYPLYEYKSKFPTYQLLRRAYEEFTALVKDSALHTAIDSLQGVEDADSTDIANMCIIIKKELPFLETTENDTMPASTQLLKAYQYYFRIKPTGKLDTNTLKHLVVRPDSLIKKLRINMERIRWRQQQFGDLYLVVDIPLMELFLRRNGENAMHMRVVVGKPSRATLAFDATMTNILINPPWGVPPTILKMDVLPGMEKSGARYLAKKGLKAYDKNGKIVNAGKINAKNYRRYTYKQAPGAGNSLGYVKFNLNDPFDIYLHDTPHRGDFVNEYRALSSGCVRVQQPQEMALYILSQIEGRKDYTQEKLSKVISTHKSSYEKMSQKIPVHLMYLTNFEDSTGKHLLFTKDIYNLDEDMMEAMEL